MTKAEQLRALWDDIHKETLIRDNSRREHYSYKETRALTEQEWELVVDAIQEGFPATLYSHGFGFTFAICVFEPSVPMYPGTEEKPKPVILVAANQYPGNGPEKLRDEQKLSCSASGKGGVFDVFEALCNTPENLARLKQEGLEIPQARSRYEY